MKVDCELPGSYPQKRQIGVWLRSVKATYLPVLAFHLLIWQGNQGIIILSF